MKSCEICGMPISDACDREMDRLKSLCREGDASLDCLLLSVDLMASYTALCSAQVNQIVIVSS